MIRMRIFRVVVLVMIMMMMVVVVMVMVVVIPAAIQTANPGAEIITQFTIGNVGSGGGGTLAFDMMVMAFLRRPNLVFKSQDLCSVFAQRTIHIW